MGFHHLVLANTGQAQIVAHPGFASSDVNRGAGCGRLPSRLAGEMSRACGRQPMHSVWQTIRRSPNRWTSPALTEAVNETIL